MQPDIDELAAIAAAPLMTGRYQTWRPEFGVPIRSTVGEYKGWRHGPIEFARPLAPWGLLSRSISDSEAERRYLDRLDKQADTVVAELAAIARRHPGQALVVLCFENVNAGQVCHRRWFARWFQQQFGIEVAELGVTPTGVSSPTLFD
jgi:hypothetical protein